MMIRQQSTVSSEALSFIIRYRIHFPPDQIADDAGRQHTDSDPSDESYHQLPVADESGAVQIEIIVMTPVSFIPPQEEGSAQS